MATSADGRPWVYNPSSNSWTVVGGPGNQFAVNAHGIFALSTNHDSIWSNVDGTANGWFNIGGSASEIFVGSEPTLFEGYGGVGSIALAASKDVYFQISSQNWVRQGGPGNMFALTFSDELYGLAPLQTSVMKSDNAYVTNPSWTAVGGPAARLFGGGQSLYAASGIAY